MGGKRGGWRWNHVVGRGGASPWMAQTTADGTTVERWPTQVVRCDDDDGICALSLWYAGEMHVRGHPYIAVDVTIDPAYQWDTANIDFHSVEQVEILAHRLQTTRANGEKRREA